MATRAAILIGVGKTGGLPVLLGAADDAAKMRDWLASEGFQSTLITDTKDGVPATGVVKAEEIATSIRALTDLGTLEQLVVYFSGHGYNNFDTEIWLLSNAPAQDNEAINLFACVEQAKDCGIPNVVFISDACRSNPVDPAARRVRGQSVFPNVVTGMRRRGKADSFLATIPNAAAYEVAETIDNITKRAGIFTAELIAAHDKPVSDDAEDALVGNININGKPTRVVLSAKLGPYLEDRVPIAIQEKTNQRQQPECNITSGLQSFIGGARFKPEPRSLGDILERQLRNTFNFNRLDADAPPIDFDSDAFRKQARTKRPDFKPTLRDVAAASLRQEPLSPSAISVAQTSGYTAARNLIVDSGTIDWRFESMTGILLSGATVASVYSHNFRHELKHQEGEMFDEVVLWSQSDRPGSVLLEFDSGKATVVVGIPEFIANVTVVDGRTANVSYTPSSNSRRWDGIGRNTLVRLQGVRSEVAAAVKFGALKLHGDEALDFADRIREFKASDPALGLYAAYAYSDADRPDQINSIRNIMRYELNFDLFDIALLAGEPTAGVPIFPFCPMLMRGWSLLLTKNVSLPRAVEQASRHIYPALWTNFDPEGVAILKTAFEAGELQ